MSEPFLGEIKIMAFNYAPRGWALCNGQQLPINQNQALFALLGTTYGGNGQTTFALPDLRGRTPLHYGAQFTQGQVVGETAHTLNIAEMPAHTHTLSGSSTQGTINAPVGALPGKSAQNAYGATNLVAMNPAVVTNTGGSQPHNNLQPYLVLNFCIALQGIFPSQN